MPKNKDQTQKDADVKPSLRDWQERFFLSLQTQTTNNVVRELIRETAEFSSVERLEVYTYAYQKRISDSLRDDFPVLLHLIGDEEFSNLCAEFLKHHASQSPNLADFSQRFSAFVANQNPQTPNDEALAELAKAEWVLCEIFHTPIQRAASPEEWQILSQSLPNKICFVIDASVRVQKWHWPVAEIWKHKRRTDKADSFSMSYRNRQGKCVIETLDRFQFELLLRICNGASLGELSEWAATVSPQLLKVGFSNSTSSPTSGDDSKNISAHADDAPMRFQMFFQKLVADGVILCPKLNR